jgi:prepilin peptidase CpaA
MTPLTFSDLMPATLVAAALLASWNDYRRHRVPNWLNAAVLTSGLIAQGAFPGGHGLTFALSGVFVGLAPLMLLWCMRAMGAGDVKFMAALGAWLGPQMTLHALVVGCLLGGVLAMAMIAARRNWRVATANVGVMMTKMTSVKTAFSEFGSVASLTSSGQVLPYAIPLSIGTLVVVFSNYIGWWEAL